MEPYKRDFFIARIMAGHIPIKMDNKRFLIYYPDVDTALRAQEKYMEAHEDAQDQGLITDDELMFWLIEQGLWSEKTENEYQKVVPGHIEYWKIELYNSVLKTNTRNRVKKYLKAAKEEYERLHSIRHHYDYITTDGYANYIKSNFIVQECARLDNKKIDWEQYNLYKLMNLYHQSMLEPEQVRELARTTPWVGLWNVLKLNGKIFDTKQITIEQQSLLSWSNMYDKIYESPDCPPEEVIHDDDMLDGWLLVQKRKREADRKKAEIEDHINPKMRNADEIVVVAETVADAQKIDMLNPEQVRKIKKQRLQTVENKGIVKEQEFKDVQQKRSMQMQQAYMQNAKRR